MARLTQAPVTSRRSVSNPDSLTDLNRLLSRLQQSILLADAERERRLRTSEYERNKAGINLEYARTLLTKLEQDALSMKIHTRRQEAQLDLNRKRELFDQLTERLRELEEISTFSDEEDDSDEEDLLGSVIIETPSESLDSQSSDRGPDDQSTGEAGSAGGEEEGEDSSYYDESTIRPLPTQTEPEPQPTSAPASHPPAAPPSASSSARTQPTSTSQSLRSRGQAPAPQKQEEGNQTSSSTTTARAQLFGNRPGSPTTALTTTATTEAILDQQRAEQDALTESLLNMARSLKSQSQGFQTDLELEKDVLGAAGSGIEKNERSMEQAARRMGTLRKMSEGKGWLGRMMLYAWIFGLMVVAILIVLVLPKLRF
ncbi:hypothetical protein BX600DRAFT_471140 [Xylariales sp. PMI_506]|nr:hypothetical protein BX600DRAFT_471140 [Xylariales sp. PMI_506]